MVELITLQESLAFSAWALLCSLIIMRVRPEMRRSVLITLGLDADFANKGGEYSGPMVANYILRDKENANSVLTMIEGARTNARAVRTTITTEMWEILNGAWNDMQRIKRDEQIEIEPLEPHPTPPRSARSPHRASPGAASPAARCRSRG